jgi:hypothetical protein
MSSKNVPATSVLSLALALAPCASRAAADEQSLETVRNTVANLLQSLVANGVVTREQAEAMVAEAQARAERDAQAKSAAGAPRDGEVRVTYVPQKVKDELREQVKAEVTPEVVNEVLAQAKADKWGVPGALPDWVGNVKFSGDVRVREQADLYASDNAQYAYLDFLTINDKGGIAKAGPAAFLNTTEDRLRTRVRVRAGLEARLGDSFSTGLRLATGNFRDPVSTNQTLSQNGGRYTFGVEQAWIRYDARSTADWSWLTATAGRMANPFVSTDLVYDPDLAFEGFAATGRMGLDGLTRRHNAYLTLGAFPLEEVELSKDDKWLYGAQAGLNWQFEDRSRLRAAVAYYAFDNVAGQRNTLDSTLLDYTASKWLQKGNTLFDIRNDTDPTTNLFALAADYEVADVFVGYDRPFSNGTELSLQANYVRNVGYDEDAVAQRTGFAIPARVNGYQFELAYGHPRVDTAGAWRASLRYRYLERDAVLDAFTDSDFHLGGTDAQGYQLRGDYGLARNVHLTLRYLSANEIDGPPLGIDVFMLDLNAGF